MDSVTVGTTRNFSVHCFDATNNEIPLPAGAQLTAHSADNTDLTVGTVNAQKVPLAASGPGGQQIAVTFNVLNSNGQLAQVVDTVATVAPPPPVVDHITVTEDPA